VSERMEEKKRDSPLIFFFLRERLREKGWEELLLDNYSF